MKLKEDLIIIDAEEAKDKLYNLKAEIEKAEGNLKVFLCDLFDIYMFQVFSGGMPISSEESKAIPEGGDELIHSDLTKKEWDELQEWRNGLDVKFEESLTEGSNYSDQVDKMKQLENGTRGFNAKAASDSKLRMNQQICISHNLQKALSIVETEMLARGLISQRTNLNPQPAPQLQRVTLTIELGLDDFHTADGFFIRDAADTSNIIKNNVVSDPTETIRHLLISLIWALCLQKPSGFIQALKLFLVNNCNYSEDQIKETINKCLTNPDIISRLNQGTKDINNN